MLNYTELYLGPYYTVICYTTMNFNVDFKQYTVLHCYMLNYTALGCRLNSLILQ